MHIVYISREYPPSFRAGGIASYIKEISIAMTSLGHKVTVIAASDDTKDSSETNEGGIRVFRLSGGDFFINSVEKKNAMKKIRIFYRFRSYRKAIAKKVESLENIDIIECAEYGAEGLFLTPSSCPIIVRLHCSLLFSRSSQTPKKFKWWQFPWYWLCHQEITFQKKSRFISSCSDSLKVWSHLYLGIPLDRITTIYNPVNTDLWATKSNCSYHPNSILFTGTVADFKGISTLIEACARLRSMGRNITLTVAGKQGEYGLDLQRETKNAGYSWCTFLGQVDRSHLCQLYGTHEIVCLPSWWENMPMVCLEAMSCGCIVIGSNSGGMAEIISHGINGFLVSPKDVGRLSDILVQALDLDPKDREAMSTAARSTIELDFSTHAVARQMEKYYRQIIDQFKQ